MIEQTAQTNNSISCLTAPYIPFLLTKYQCYNIILPLSSIAQNTYHLRLQISSMFSLSYFHLITQIYLVILTVYIGITEHFVGTELLKGRNLGSRTYLGEIQEISAWNLKCFGNFDKFFKNHWFVFINEQSVWYLELKHNF